VDKDGIDASIGLAFSLELFKRYRSTGILQAKLRRFPGMQGPGIAYLYLAEGDVVLCYTEDQNGHHSSVSKDVLIRFDNEKGPFEWGFRPSSVAPAPLTLQPVSAVQPRSQNAESLSFHIPNATVPRIISALPSERLLGWTLQQRRMFLLVWQAIDGKRTAQDIKGALRTSLPEATVDEILHTLLKLNLIVIST
jgi:hypothetical protein